MKTRNQYSVKNKLVKFAQKNNLEYSLVFDQKEEYWTIRVTGRKYVMDLVVYQHEQTTPIFTVIQKTEDNPMGKIQREWSGIICSTYNEMFKNFVAFEYSIFL